MRSTRRSVSRCSKGRRRRRGRAPSRRALEGQFHVGVAGDLPSHLVDGAMMLIAELHEVLDIGKPAIDPVPYVVHVGGLGVWAAREPASLVAPSDLYALGVTGVPACSSEVQAPAIGSIGGDKDLGIAREPP